MLLILGLKNCWREGKVTDVSTANSSYITPIEYASLFDNIIITFFTRSLVHFRKHFWIFLIQVKSLSFLSQYTIYESDIAFSFISPTSHIALLWDMSFLAASLFHHALSSLDLEVLQGLQSFTLVGTSSFLLLRYDWHAKGCPYLMCTNWWVWGQVYTYETINNTKPWRYLSPPNVSSCSL